MAQARINARGATPITAPAIALRRSHHIIIYENANRLELHSIGWRFRFRFTYNSTNNNRDRRQLK
jgi:hypothetical protein